MSEDRISPLVGPRRKRVRKGTRSCWECKRRKIKCRYETDSHAICISCLDKGTKCVSQEFEDELVAKATDNEALAQRLERVEALLERLTQQRPYATSDDRGSTQQRPHAKENDRSFSQSTDVLASILTPPDASPSRQPVREGCEGLRQRLASLLPAHQEEWDYLSEISEGWWLLRRHIMPDLFRITETELQERFDLAKVSVSHPVVIARFLLCLALCVQQLPPEIEPHKLGIHVRIEEIPTLVAAEVTSNDEIIGSLVGVECLFLQGVYHVNAGNLRRAWLTFRRAVTVAQLMGLHRSPTNSRGEAQQDLKGKRYRHLWYHVLRGEQLLSLILGVPSATAGTLQTCDIELTSFTPEDHYNGRLTQISSLVLARNQGDATHAVSATQEIDGKLDMLAKQMPSTWWQLPTSMMHGRTEAVANQFERFMCQIAHFELQALANLPFMLRGATERRFEYFRMSCLEASRSLVIVWRSMRWAYGTTFLSNLVDFQAFTATVTLLLGLLSSSPANASSPSLKDGEDYEETVRSVVEVFEASNRTGKGVHVVNQSISAIRALLQAVQDRPNVQANLRISIPHYGNIIIARGGTVQSVVGERLQGANPSAAQVSSYALPGVLSLTGVNALYSSSTPTPKVSISGHQGWNGSRRSEAPHEFIAAETYNTMLHFTSNQMPLFEANTLDDVANWNLPDVDTSCIDSLLATDVEGSWNL